MPEGTFKSCWLVVGMAAFLAHEVRGDSPDHTPAVTQADVIPILLRRCTVCHGARDRGGDLDLRTKASMLQGGKSGPALVPGKPEESLILKKIRGGEMPPRQRIVEVSVKPIEPREAELLTHWIELGAPEEASELDGPDPLVKDEDRDFWAFRPPRPVQAPWVSHPEQVKNPIDAFILQKLEERGLALSPNAEPAVLIRRAYLDITGLPPEPEEVREFLLDHDPFAYEKMIDRLLASPRYGERGGRQWLDIAGYADSEGKREQDLARPFAYLYRDYVIRSFNSDKPYDRFLLEQIAGDELADYEHATKITQEIEDNLVATGFLRMAPDPTWANITNFIPDRVDVVADEMDVLGSGILGLTIKCARCHNHKFDPIPQRDYYRLLDIFKGAFDEHDWMKSGWLSGISAGKRSDRDLPYVAAARRLEWEAHNGKIGEEIAALQAMLQALGKECSRESEQIDQRIKALEAHRLPEPRIRALWDRGEPSPTYIYLRGDYLNPGRPVGPGVPAALTNGRAFEARPPWPGAKKTGRRLAFAQWIVSPESSLVARVLVNRLWRQHFGVGIVKTLGNFGKTGARPTHPELLDWLAVEVVRGGWSLKRMHRLMLTSSTYRQASRVTAAHEKQDPENKCCSRMPLRRMDAEVLYDSLLLASGQLDETRYGPSDKLAARGDGLVTPFPTEKGWRRGIYVSQERKEISTLLECFDLPPMNPNCLERRNSNVVTQALYLMNNGMLEKLAKHFAERVEREADGNRASKIDRAYLIAFSRFPSDAEKAAGLEALAELSQEWERHLEETSEPHQGPAAFRALATYCHAILNSAEFLYID